MDKQIYIIALIEGILVMAIELLSARLITPVYGSSVYVWTCVIGITMMALLAGYYLGGIMVMKNIYQKYYITFIHFSAIWVILMPIISSLILKQGLSLGLVTGTLLSVNILISIPLILLGSVSPQLIQAANDQAVMAGKAAGNIYAISTAGGVMSTFVLGLYCIPQLGLKYTSILVGLIALVVSTFSVIKQIKWKSISSLILLIGSASILFAFNLSDKSIIHTEGSKLIYSSDTHLGRLDVIDIDDNIRVLANNLTFQSIISKNNGVSQMSYTYVISTIASLRQMDARGSVALVGMAGGTLVKELKSLGYQKITAIDIDPRTQKIAEEYFETDPKSYSFIEDDGRHFLSVTNHKYDVIIIDVSASEQQPYYLYTKEAISLYKNALKNTGIIIMNIIDYSNPKEQKILEKIGDGMVESNFITFMVKDFYPSQLLQFNNMESKAHEFIIFGFNGEPNNLSNDIMDMTPASRINQFNIQLKTHLKDMVFLKQTVTNGAFFDDLPEMESLSFERTKLLRTQYLFTTKINKNEPK